MDNFNNHFNKNSTGTSHPYGITNQTITGSRYFNAPNDPWHNNIGGLSLNEAENLIRMQALKFEADQQLTQTSRGNFSTLRDPYNFSSDNTESPFPIVKEPQVSVTQNENVKFKSPEFLQRNPAFHPKVEVQVSNKAAPTTKQLNENETKPRIVKSENEKPNLSGGTSAAEDRRAFPSFRFMKFKKKLGICVDQPHIKLTPSELKDLQNKILDKILSPEGQKVKPRFFGVSASCGFLVLTCGDDTTVSWVKALAKKWRGPNGTRLKVVENPQEEKTFVVVGHFPRSENEPNSRILKFLSAQNEDLDVTRWRVLNRVHDKEAVRLTLALDFTSAQLLKYRGPRLNYKFGVARFMLKTKNRVRFKDEEFYTDDDDDDDEWDDVCDEEEELSMFTENPNPLAYSETKPSTSGNFLLSQSGMGNQIPGFPGMEAPVLQGFYELQDKYYQAQIANILQKSKNSLLHGLNSRARFLSRKNNVKKAQNKRKKKKKQKQKELRQQQQAENEPPAGVR